MLHKQSTNIFVKVLFIFTFYRIKKLSYYNYIYIIISYFYVDFYFFVSHLYLDDERTINDIFMKKYAKDFQEHHNNPISITTYNHAGLFNPIFTFLLLEVNLFTTTNELLVFVLSGIIFNYIALANHAYCHAKRQNIFDRDNYEYNLFLLFQNIGLFISPKHHAEHHKTLNRNYSFLYGFDKLYLRLWNKTPIYRYLQIIFYIANPISITSFLLLLVHLKCKTGKKKLHHL